jgi:hypothetical protein
VRRPQSAGEAPSAAERLIEVLAVEITSKKHFKKKLDFLNRFGQLNYRFGLRAYF